MDDCDNISVISTIVPYIGREKEKYLLQEIYKKERSFGQVVWISGASGVGKSALIQDFLSEKKYVCSGKFDFMKHPSTPYSAIVMIMSDLCSILEEAQERCVKIILCPEWIAILSKLVPQITTITQCEEDDNDDDDDGNDDIVGKQYTESQRRRNQENQLGDWGIETLKEAIKNFVKKAIAMISSYSVTPLIILMDNLQWADDASLDILRNTLEDCINIHRFIFVGSYRDNEIEPNSPFWDFKENLDRSKENSYDSSIDNNSGGRVEISLDSLTLEDVIHLVANIIQMNPIQSEELGRLVYDITRGDALFVKRYLYHVMERKMIRPRDNGPGWDFDDVKLRAQVEVGEDIVNFLTEEMRRLPSSTIEVLKIASFMGPEVDIILLETIVHTWEDTILLSNQTFYEILEQMESRGYIIIDDNDDNDSKGVLHFPHDRILRAAYCLVSEEHVQQFHLRIGRLILQIHYDEYQESKSKNMLLLAIDQLNRGRTWIETIKETNDLAMLNLQAAQEMIAWSAFNLAKSHLMISLELLGEHCWRDHYEMTLKVSNLLASVLSGNGSMLECLDLIEKISQHCTSPEDRYFTQVIRLEILTCIHRLEDCIQASMTMLSELRFPKIPSHPGYSMIVSSVMEVKRILKTLSSEEILSLPLCNDKRIQHAVKIRKEKLMKTSILSILISQTL
jgi:predicted ATPase